MGRYYDVYSYSSDLEIRNNYVNYAYNSASMIPISSIDIVSLAPQWDSDMLMKVSNLYDAARLSNAMCEHPYIETMYKQHRELLFKMCCSIGLTDIVRYAPEIKIALRHGYKFHDISMWRDAMQLAQEFNIETRNPYYCASEDINDLHDRLMRKKKKDEEDQRIKRELDTLQKNIKRYSDLFNKHIKPYINLTITNGDIEIRPLRSIEEYCNVGIKMHNCVYACEYFKKTGSLVLLATYHGEIAELIELDLASKTIKQCRGKWNKQTIMHKEIVSLLENNITLIKAA